MAEMSERDWSVLQEILRRAMATHVPEWTTQHDADPGITVLQLLAFLAEALAERSQRLPERAKPLLARLEDALARLDGGDRIDVHVNGERWTRVADVAEAPADVPVFSLDRSGAVAFGDGRHGRRPPAGSRVAVQFRDGAGPEDATSLAVRSSWPPHDRLYTIALAVHGTLRLERLQVGTELWSRMKRPTYFTGQLLTVEDFRAGQEYFLRKHRLHLSRLHGAGIVAGLGVEVGSGGATVRMSEGLALDEEGREVQVGVGASVDVPVDARPPLYVVVEYAERETDHVPSPSGSGTKATRIEEGSRISLSGDPACSPGVCVARLVLADGQWAVDGSYDPPRPK